MERTQRLRPIDDAAALGRHGMPIALAVALALMLGLDVLLVVNPQLASSSARLWRELIASQDGHATLIAFARAGLAVGSSAIAVAVLAAFIRGVQVFPYVWLAPVLVGFSSVVIARMPVSLPPPLTAASFAIVCAVLLLGGGALLQLRALAPRAAGALFLLAPVMLLAASYAVVSQGTISFAPLLTADARLLLFVVTTTSLGVAFVALATASTETIAQRAHERAAIERVRSAERMRERRSHEAALEHAQAHLRASHERAELAEQRASSAEHALRLQGAELEAALAAQAELDGFERAAKPWLVRLAWPLAMLTLVLASLAGGYYLAYRPLAASTASLRAQLAHDEGTRANALAELRTRFEAERSALRLALGAQQAKAQSATQKLQDAERRLGESEAKLAAAKATTPAALQPTAASHGKPRATKPATRLAAKPAAKPVAKHAAKPTPAVATKTAPTTSTTSAGVSASDDPLLGL